jgi:bifunctional UDP-N-acetylglucosamine pyrophosphorylase / glucosamine-1-phosphate N-acetyltransferase
MVCESVILAAGLGTRMNSNMPKVLHPLGGKPILTWAVQAAAETVGRAPTVVVGPGAEDIRQMVGPKARFVEQPERMGTGHATLQASKTLKGQSELVLVTNADLPLLTAETLRRLVTAQETNPGPLTLLSVQSDSARGFGRVIRDAAGRVARIVEEAHATPEERKIRELNVGAYCFRASWLWDSLPRLPLSPKGEYYLTDLIGMAAGEGGEIVSVECQDADEVIGINTREHLAQAEAALRRRINRRWMLAGVTLVDPATAYIGPDVTLDQDCVILPNTCLEGATAVGKACRIGPNTIIRDTTMGDRCTVEASVLEGARLDNDVDVGPFAHLRPGAHLMRGVHMGNFGEVKSSTLGPGTKMGHFAYVGDATIGADVNIGAGAITCNFDGEKKNPTDIGAEAFIGSDTMLVAPVRVGRGARTGAGAVVTKDVPDDTLAVGMPARNIRKLKRPG